MKTEIEIFENVLRKILVPAFDVIKDLELELWEGTDYFLVTYFVDPTISNSDAGKIVTETNKLLRMIDGDFTVRVDFESNR
jgi:hypothetical protein